MATKIFVSYSGSVLSSEKSKLIQKQIADALCVCPEDVLVLPDVSGVSVVDVPDTMTKAREKQEAKQEVKEAEKASEKEAEKEAHTIYGTYGVHKGE